MRNDATAANKAAVQAEVKLLFRADTDQNGDWYVWRRLGPHGWATMRRCGDQDEAEQIAETMNRDSTVSVFGI